MTEQGTRNESGDWLRVHKTRPCPICEKPDWCLIAADASAAICTRIESPKRCGDAGWLHRLAESPQRLQRRMMSIRRLEAHLPAGDWARLAQQFQEAVDPVRLCQFADAISISLTSLCQLSVGWSREHRAWSFPMRDADGHVLGIRLRRPNGSKFSVRGGKEGLFLPNAAADPDNERLLVCEGATDTAALLDMGFVNVVGRPSCTGGMKLLVDLVRRRQPQDVVIVADRDEPGLRGADNLASVLVAYSAVVRVIRPRDGLKDVRDWLRADGTHRDIQEAIDAAPARRLAIRSTKIGKGK